MNRGELVESLALSAAFAGIATVATVSLGHHVAELFAALAMGLAILGLVIAGHSASRGTGVWRPSPLGVGFDAAGLLAALASSTAPQAEYRAMLIAFAAIAAGARIADGYKAQAVD
jgi:hypothetical protein